MTATMEKTSMDKSISPQKPPYDDTGSTTSTAPPPYQSASSSSPSLTIKYRDWRSRHGVLIDTTTGATLYTSEHRYRKPTFTLANAQGTPVANAASSAWTMKFDFHLTGVGAFELTPRHKLGCDVTYPSPAYGQTLTWKSTKYWNRLEYVLLDEGALPIARFLGGSAWKCMPWGEFGGFEFVEGRVETEAARDEVVATGLCVAYKAVVSRQASTSAVVVS